MADDEYESIQRRCLQDGCRSLSAYVRHILLQADRRAAAGDLGWDLATVSARLRRLDVELRELRELIRHTIGAPIEP